MNRVLIIALCSAVFTGCSTTSQVKEDTSALFQQMRDEQSQQMAELRKEVSKQSSLTAEDVAAIVDQRLAVRDTSVVQENVQVDVPKSVDKGQFITAELTENCIIRIMSAAADIKRPTNAKMAAYVCSHVYGLNHQRTLEIEKVLVGLGQGNRKFDAELKQDISDDSDIVLDNYALESLLRTVHQE